MTEEQQAELLAAWLADPGAPLPEGLDPDVVETVVALQPQRAPAPRVSIDSILDGVSSGPLAMPVAVQPYEPIQEPANNRGWFVGALAMFGGTGAVAAAAMVLVVGLALTQNRPSPMGAAEERLQVYSPSSQSIRDTGGVAVASKPQAPVAEAVRAPAPLAKGASGPKAAAKRRRPRPSARPRPAPRPAPAMAPAREAQPTRPTLGMQDPESDAVVMGAELEDAKSDRIDDFDDFDDQLSTGGSMGADGRGFAGAPGPSPPPPPAIAELAEEEMDMVAERESEPRQAEASRRRDEAELAAQQAAQQAAATAAARDEERKQAKASRAAKKEKAKSEASSPSEPSAAPADDAPSNPLAQGRASLAAGDPTSALTHVDRGLAMYGGDSLTRKNLFTLRGDAYTALGKTGKAERAYAEAAAIAARL